MSMAFPDDKLDKGEVTAGELVQQIRIQRLIIYQMTAWNDC